MTSHALHDYPKADLSRWVIAGFLSGAVSVLLFHQGAAALLYALELSTRAPYSMQATAVIRVDEDGHPARYYFDIEPSV